mmetsp:Transcript_78591/g.168417  ORF Transcript_78591/g.168417 Transcript_78591/m.168417 type:complete len:423 (-) Transcript_78591:93-1361(-)|eukprot:CAMPEP_0180429718 /NCGR_PEP_ID=MMETSP1036_2-20121128/7517_1 /TAXON_ID=632150 /ORGANISM="Azadinium spinosum, Strain 3D9" /LENGTH=422 /DNA_ID=CAMNT_0022435435 /DNA_START=73 /DNA_END=1341 /DNA_ORIENTATION=+
MGDEGQVEEYQEPQEEPPHMTYLRSLLPVPKAMQVGLMPDENPISILDQHMHSVSTKQVVLQIWDNPFAKMVLNMRLSARIGELQNELASTLGVDPNSIQLIFKDGQYYKQAYETQEIRGKILVKGISNFTQVCIPLVERTKWMPGFDMLPQSRKNKLGGRAPPKKPKTRLYVFYGPGDGFAKDWADYIVFSPEWIEIIVFEWAGHGQRDEEDLPEDIAALAADAMQGLGSTFEQHKAGGQAEIASFSFIGHGTGALVMIEVAKIIEEKFQIKPGIIFVLDRPAPSSPFLSEHGTALLTKDPEAFMAEWIPAKEDDGQGGKKEKDFSNFAMEQARYLEMGDSTYKFSCPIMVYRVSTHWSAPTDEVQKKSLVADKATYDDWQNFTTDTMFMKDIDTDYFALRTHGEFVDEFFRKQGELLMRK